MEIVCNPDDEKAIDEPAHTSTSTTPVETPAPSTSTTDNDGVPAKWVPVASHKNMQAAIGAAPIVKCQQCGYECTSLKHLLLHARLHLVHYLCKCGYASKWCETIRKHRIDPCNACDPEGPIYEVDQASFNK